MHLLSEIQNNRTLNRQSHNSVNEFREKGVQIMCNLYYFQQELQLIKIPYEIAAVAFCDVLSLRSEIEW